MGDLLIKETGNGGDCVFAGSDLVAVAGYENTSYLAMFSGNDWWGNDLLLGSEDASASFLSETEKTLREVALNSTGRIRIEQAVKTDLAFLQKQAIKVDVATTLEAPDRLGISITINGKSFYYNWNPDNGFLKYQV